MMMTPNLYPQLAIARFAEAGLSVPLRPTTAGSTLNYQGGVSGDGGVVMTRVYQILLIGESQHDPWQSVLEEVSADLGCLEVTHETGTTRRIQAKVYDIIVIDATVVENIPDLMRIIKAQNTKAQIVVATASPVWEKAREAFRAGAADYIRKSMNKKRLFQTLKTLGMRQM